MGAKRRSPLRLMRGRSAVRLRVDSFQAVAKYLLLSAVRLEYITRLTLCMNQLMPHVAVLFLCCCSAYSYSCSACSCVLVVCVCARPEWPRENGILKVLFCHFLNYQSSLQIEIPFVLHCAANDDRTGMKRVYLICI